MMDNKKTLYLLDAYALIFRAYYAFIRAPRINSKGLNTSAVFGFVNTLRDIIDRENPQYLGVVIDYPGPTFRNEIYSEYKAQREATPEDIKKAVPYIRQILDAMQIPLIEIAGFEADDVIGTLAVKASSEGYITYMVTPDKDFAQLVNENIKIYKPRSKSNEIDIWGIAEVKEHFNVPAPANVVDVLALWGDAADNVPGCPGIGEKTAKEIIGKYGTVASVYEHINDFKGKQKQNLIEYRKQVEQAHRLITIETAVPLNCSLESFKFNAPDMEKLKELFEELEFKSLWQKISSKTAVYTPSQPDATQGSLFGQPPADSVVVKSRFKTIAEVQHNYRLIEGEQALAQVAAELAQQKSFSFDTETTGLDVANAELVGVSFSWKAHEACYIPVPENFNDAKAVVAHFKQLLESPSIEKVGQNIKFDAMILKRYGISVCAPLFDTMIAHHLLQPGLKHNMDYLSETCLNYTPVSIESLIGAKGKGQKNMRHVPLHEIGEYAAEDADVTLQLKNILEKELINEGLQSFFSEVEIPLTLVLADMERTGVKIDVNELNRCAHQLEERLRTLEKEIASMAGIEFNINSPKQVGEVLFNRLKIGGNAGKTQKSGQYSTGEDVLQKLKDRHPIVPLILEQRGVKKLLSTYVDALPQMVDKNTGRLHTSYNQAVVVTGRLSSSNPNLQNIPIRDGDGREIRKAFVVDDTDNSKLFLSADYSQVELRIMAHLSEDKNLIAAFNRGDDIHAATAALIYKIPLTEVTSDMRRKAKTANFGIIYGISTFGLAERLNIPRSDAKALIDGYFASFPGVKACMDASILKAREKGYVETIFGRRRYLPDINSRNAVVRGVAERNAINTPIQGTAADIVKKAMVDIHSRLNAGGFRSKMILQVHDELNFEVLASELNDVKALVKDGMENTCKLAVPLAVDMGTGKNWLEAH